MASTLGVTRWLIAPRGIVAQTGLVVLLLGVIAGQNLDRLRQAPERACAVEPARPPQEVRAAEPARADPPAAPARRLEALEPAPLTETERWITTPTHDAARTGYAVWAVLRPGGTIVIERCRAPDWTAPPAALPTPVCDVVLEQVIAAIDPARIDLRNGRSFRYSLARRDGVELLRMSLAEELELVPGSKSTLVSHLGALSGDAPARARWARVARGQRTARAAK